MTRHRLLRAFAHQAVAPALASLLGLSPLTAACGSGANDDDASALTRRQPSAGTEEGADPSNDDTDDTENDEAEPPPEGALDGAELDSEDPPRASGGEADAPEAPPPDQVFAACLSAGGAYEDCDTIYVTMRESDPPRCVQLTLDNCGAYGRRTLTVEAPTQWELISGSIGTSPAACELGVFNASSTVFIDATGTIDWDDAAPVPTELELELTLTPSRTGGDVPSIEIATSEPLDVAECPEE